MTALLIEDDEILAKLLIEKLLEVCTSVKHCATLLEAQEYRATLPQCPGLVWQDARLPGSEVDDSFAETRAIREACPDSIIVYFTGMHVPGLVQKAFAAGADNVSFKPSMFNPIDLVRLIGVAAFNAMDRGSSNSIQILENVCSMAAKYFMPH